MNNVSTYVARVYRFRATHSLPDFSEPWCFPHQHDYTVEVIAVGGKSTDDLDEVWNRGWPVKHVDGLVLYKLDGENLNDLFESTTVEALAEGFLAMFRAADADVICVKVKEDEARWGMAQLDPVSPLNR